VPFLRTGGRKTLKKGRRKREGAGTPDYSKTRFILYSEGEEGGRSTIGNKRKKWKVLFHTPEEEKVSAFSSSEREEKVPKNHRKEGKGRSPRLLKLSSREKSTPVGSREKDMSKKKGKKENLHSSVIRWKAPLFLRPQTQGGKADRRREKRGFPGGLWGTRSERKLLVRSRRREEGRGNDRAKRWTLDEEASCVHLLQEYGYHYYGEDKGKIGP